MKRSDLIKRFEQHIQQEIINHNSQIYDTNQAINDIRKSISDLSNSLSNSISVINSQMVNISGAIESISKRMESKVLEVSKVANDSKCLSEKVASKQDHLDSKIEGVSCKREKDVKDYSSISQSLSNLDSNVKQLDMKLGQEISYMTGKLNFTLEEVKRKCEEIPVYFRKFESDVSNALETQRVDINSFRQEIESLKKIVHYQEKKIENLYTLNSRVNFKLDSDRR